MVEIFFPSIISNVTESRHETIPSNTFNETLKILVEKYGSPLKDLIFEENGEINRFLQFYLNGKKIDHRDLKHTKLGENDELAILVVITGG
jgi:molybdopterin synthase sulfur carrier subunit